MNQALRQSGVGYDGFFKLQNHSRFFSFFLFFSFGTAALAMNQALSQSGLGHHAAGAQLLRNMLPTVRRVLGPEHTDTVYAERMLAEIESRMRAQGDECRGSGGDEGAAAPPSCAKHE